MIHYSAISKNAAVDYQSISQHDIICTGLNCSMIWYNSWSECSVSTQNTSNLIPFQQPECQQIFPGKVNNIYIEMTQLFHNLQINQDFYLLQLCNCYVLTHILPVLHWVNIHSIWCTTDRVSDNQNKQINFHTCFGQWVKVFERVWSSLSNFVFVLWVLGQEHLKKFHIVIVQKCEDKLFCFLRF